MPASTVDINLLGQEDLQFSPWGRILTWSTTYGRYIMILTEIVVLLAFISRFSLDRKLTDLKEEIAQKQAIIEANSSFENELLSLQDRMKSIKSLAGEQNLPRDLVEELQRVLPPDVHFESFTLNERSLTLKTTAATTAGFSQFVSNILGSAYLERVEIGEIKKNPLTGIQFQLTAQLKKAGTKK